MYKVTIETSVKELSVLDRVKVKEAAGCHKIDDLVANNGGRYGILFANAVKLRVESDQTESPEYNRYVFIDMDGELYTTSSDNVYNKFCEIYDEIKDYEGEWSLIFTAAPSKKYAGKNYLTCTING